MNNKQKQIQEIADALYNSQYEYDLSNPFEVAKVVIDLGYRKIPENAVVLEISVYESLEIKNYKDIISDRVRKETAEKFAERLKKVIHERDYIEGYAYLGICEEIDEICKEMVEGK